MAKAPKRQPKAPATSEDVNRLASSLEDVAKAVFDDGVHYDSSLTEAIHDLAKAIQENASNNLIAANAIAGAIGHLAESLQECGKSGLSEIADAIDAATPPN